MDFSFNEEQEELRSIARAFLEERADSESVRKAMETESGFDAGLWEALSTELGWTAVHIPEAYGGLGLGHVELGALMEIMGGQLLCSPFFSSICLAANAVLTAGSEAQKKEYLPELAEGQMRAALAYSGESGLQGFDAITPVLRIAGDELILDGTHGFVVDGHTADGLIVAARAPGSAGEEGVSLVWVPAESDGLTRKLRPTLDQTRRLAQVHLDAVRLPKSALLGEAGSAAAPLAHALACAAMALACEQVGGAQRCLDLAVAYSLERVQFGRPIGSFQSIKHKCADMMIAVECARSAAYYAACECDEETSEMMLNASLAKASASDTYFQCASESLQIHGGVGFTWEYDVHLHFKRAKATETLLGDPAWHREQVARFIGL
ncbi:acyl-CoA/acyl-ACP dehydrogenase [Myxococcota bacterium]|nr:acyl-CoA/acyl-ACP dehydrogenase [Myxococcota bacterium]